MKVNSLFFSPSLAFVCFSAVAWAQSADSYVYAPTVLTEHQHYAMYEHELNASDYESLSFENIIYEGNGAALYHEQGMTAVMDNNGAVRFVGNMALPANPEIPEDEWYIPVAYSFPVRGGAICKEFAASFSISHNGIVEFVDNAAISPQDSEDTWDYTMGGAIYNCSVSEECFSINENAKVTFVGNRAEAQFAPGAGGGISNYGNFELNGNEEVIFQENSTNGAAGAIYHTGNSFTFHNNGKILFCDNVSATQGAAIFVNGPMSIHRNGEVIFENNTCAADFEFAEGGAICNFSYSFVISENEKISFCGNALEGKYQFADGGAIWSVGELIMQGNGDILFSKNSVVAGRFARGGAIWTGGILDISHNGNVLFERNAEILNGEYRLRGLYADSKYGQVNLAAEEGKSITFRDSLYAEGAVTLNRDYTDGEGVTHQSAGSIIFTGATTEADLREVKGGADGTVEEILNSRTSEIATNAKLYGGRLIVEDGAILKGQGITVMNDANATIRLNNGEIDESGYEIAVSAGSGLEFEGVNTLTASTIRMEDGATLSFVMGGVSDTILTLDGALQTGRIRLSLSGDIAHAQQLLTLADSSLYDMENSWTAERVTVVGTDFDNLVWRNGTLTYNPRVKPDISLDGDETTSTFEPTENGNISINGNGHTLTVKNEVQLVQMALKNGTVKLEGGNNNIVSVTLDENGTLVLSSGAGLSVGNIVSMVANGSADLVVSENITIDSTGMRGQKGSAATISNAAMQTSGDWYISDVELNNILLDVADKSVLHISDSTLHAGTRLSKVSEARSRRTLMRTLALMDEANRTMVDISNVIAELDESNVQLVEHYNSDNALALYLSGNTEKSITLAEGAECVRIESNMFSGLTLTGDSLWLDMSAELTGLWDGCDIEAVIVEFNDTMFDMEKLAVFTTLNNKVFQAYMNEQATMLCFNVKSPNMPEPATAALSLLALAGLVARRRRK